MHCLTYVNTRIDKEEVKLLRQLAFRMETAFCCNFSLFHDFENEQVTETGLEVITMQFQSTCVDCLKTLNI